MVDLYETGDELYFFGFSRGAYTVRSLAGLIRKCVVLRRERSQLVGEAYRIYRLGLHDGPAEVTGVDGSEAVAFRQANSIADVPIHSIGVWDTVGALGIPLSLRNPIRWVVNRSLQCRDVRLSRIVRHAYQALAIDEKREAFAPAIWQRHTEAPAEQVVEQRWFYGCHSDVGGGNGNTSASDITLRWMLEKAQNASLEIDIVICRHAGLGGPDGADQ